MIKRDMFDNSELGLGNHAFSKVEEADPWWRERRRDYSALARFWCPDLLITRHLFAGGRHVEGGFDLWEVKTPSGKRVAFGTTMDAAWKLTLAMIFFHMRREREKREKATRWLVDNGHDELAIDKLSESFMKEEAHGD